MTSIGRPHMGRRPRHQGAAGRCRCGHDRTGCACSAMAAPEPSWDLAPSRVGRARKPTARPILFSMVTRRHPAGHREALARGPTPMVAQTVLSARSAGLPPPPPATRSRKPTSAPSCAYWSRQHAVFGCDKTKAEVTSRSREALPPGTEVLDRTWLASAWET